MKHHISYYSSFHNGQSMLKYCNVEYNKNLGHDYLY